MPDLAGVTEDLPPYSASTSSTHCHSPSIELASSSSNTSIQHHPKTSASDYDDGESHELLPRARARACHTCGQLVGNTGAPTDQTSKRETWRNWLIRAFVKGMDMYGSPGDRLGWIMWRLAFSGVLGHFIVVWTKARDRGFGDVRILYHHLTVPSLMSGILDSSRYLVRRHGDLVFLESLVPHLRTWGCRSHRLLDICCDDIPNITHGNYH